MRQIIRGEIYPAVVGVFIIVATFIMVAVALFVITVVLNVISTGNVWGF